MNSRAQFEEWAKVVILSLEVFKNGDHKGEYKRKITRDTWEAWEASRAAIEVELPEKISPHNTNESGHVIGEADMHDEAIDDCGEALGKAGRKND
ncbi:hypothetical protein EXT67_20860 [Pectobacterium atrosepticum]|uniref:Uncharacterized protein n=1 Tax=Pectobacterium phage phiTE TaxID=1116482 RepID=K9L4T0_9CAUD|nr:hypothetical protein [Pectobacterium atrosepticum]YP_007392477.1 hypothetical protein phiTE_015 [Pectobacterium phage phiTE]AEZ66181.1 hypothetical protein phiTE_015 [Pectobacterium phage phiTE]MCL6318754.1 hypothetical protein [Pectobacterium atrosepticum]